MKYKLVMFDLDGTLAESKQALIPSMAELLAKLMEKTNVAIVSGGALSQFRKQVVAQLPHDANFHNLYLLPTSGGALYEWNGDDWKKVYEIGLGADEAEHITRAIEQIAKETGLIDLDGPSWGPHIEYRGSEESVSALGQQAPIAAKKAWDPDKSKRKILQKKLADKLPGFHVGMGGATTIDITREGIDKAYGIHQLAKRLNIKEADVLYVGDELEAGGNDEPVYKTSVQTRAVASPFDTEKLIKELLG